MFLSVKRDGKLDFQTKPNERIAKRMARAGLCSRREAEQWIKQGRVLIDGCKISSPAQNVDDTSIVEVDGRRLSENREIMLWRYHKPLGLIVTNNDPEGRRTIFETLPKSMPRVITIGRLDINSEGLLLLTNNGDIARFMEHPSTGWIRRYRVRVNGKVSESKLMKLGQGITVSGVRYGPISACLDRKQGANAWITIKLREGKNREIRNVMEYLGYKVTRLIRVSHGPFQLGNLEKGEVVKVSQKMVKESFPNMFSKN